MNGIIPQAFLSSERPLPSTTAVRIPDTLAKPVLAKDATATDRSLITPVTTMHERKALMAEQSVGFCVVSLPFDRSAS